MSITNKVNILLSAQDSASKILTNVGKSSSSLSKKIQANQATFKKMAGFGALSFGALTVGVKKLTGAYEIQLAAEKQVAAGIKSTGGIAGKTLEDLKKQASDLQGTSIFGDEDILQNVSAQFLSFSAIQGDVFDQAQQAALDLNTRLNGVNASGESLKGISIQLGKALEDPIKGMAAMSKSGITFTDSQKAMITELVEANKLQEAQAIILGEVEAKYGGSAQAAADALGPNHQLSKSFGDMMEVIGGGLKPALDDIALALAPLVTKFTELVENNPTLIKNIALITAGIIGAITVFGILGIAVPVITTGFGTMAIAVKGLGIAMSFLAMNPIGMVITAIGAGIAIGVLIVKNWDKIKETAGILGSKIVELYKKWGFLLGPIKSVINWGVAIYKNWDKIKATGIALGVSIKKIAGIIITAWANAGSNLKAIGVNIKNGFLDLVAQAKDWGSNMIQMFVDGLKAKVAAVKDGILGIATTISDYLGFHSPTKKGPASDSDKWMPNFVSMLSKGLDSGKSKVSRSALDLSTSLSQSFGEGFGMEKMQEVLDGLEGKFSTSFSNIGSQIDGTSSKIKTLKTEIEGINSKISSIKDQKTVGKEDTQSKLADRALALEKQLLNTELDALEQKRIGEELVLATQQAGAKAIDSARNWASLNESERIISLGKEKQDALDEELQQMRNALYNKFDLLKEEEEALANLNQTKIDFENQYHQLFQKNSTERILSINESITAMQRLNSLSSSSSFSSTTSIAGTRASGGSVSAGSAYMVGERGAEMFVPKTDGTIIQNSESGAGGNSIGEVKIIVNGSGNAMDIANAVERKFTETLQMYKMGIS